MHRRFGAMTSQRAAICDTPEPWGRTPGFSTSLGVLYRLRGGIASREGILGTSGHRDVVNASRTAAGSGIGRFSSSNQTCTEWTAAIKTSSLSRHTLGGVAGGPQRRLSRTGHYGGPCSPRLWSSLAVSGQASLQQNRRRCRLCEGRPSRQAARPCAR